MLLHHGYDHAPAKIRGAALAIGNFDGVHRGHQGLLAAARAAATTKPGRLAGAIVFDPHPRTVFQPDRPHFQLTTLPQKLRLMERYGMGVTVVLPFSAALAALSAQDFVERVLVAGLGVGHVVVGYDFHFGKGRAGTPQTLQAAGAEMGFGVTIVDQIGADGEVVSSSAIRAELAQGDVSGATQMLGHPWRLAGEVVSGAKRGTGLGYPTANMALPKGVTLAHGIYAVRVHTPAGVFDGAAYLGTRPTFDAGTPALETFLFDFDGDLYGRQIEIEFFERIRGDRHFESAEALVAQMDLDIAAIRTVLGSVAPSAS
jgi:riboflavin kinase/FMN adenylyltransferase